MQVYRCNGPAALKRRFATVAADSLTPIGPGLLSFAQITGGFTSYERCIPNLPQMRGFTLSITGGAIQRLETGGLSVYWEARAPYAGMQRLIERLGLTRAEAFSPANVWSDQAADPTVFDGAMSAVFPAGETMYDLAKHEDFVLPFEMNCRLKYQGAGVLTAERFRGPFELHVVCEFTDATAILRTFELTGFGRFEFRLR
jgi:hypothetical protein